MAPPKSQAHLLLEKAEKKSNSSTGWFSSASTKFEEAGDLFQQAANAFKLDKLFTEAGDAHAKEAECREKIGENSDSANAWWNAAKAYKQAGRPDLAIEALSQTITFLTKLGRFRQAADREKEIASIRVQMGDLTGACQSYQQAGDWYKQEDAKATSNTCYKDAADLAAEIGDYPRAIALYDEVAEGSLSSPLTKFSVKEYWLRLCLCCLANCDSVEAQRRLSEFAAKDRTFPTTREAKFVGALIEAIEAGDTAAFSTACVDYDQIMKLDDWKTQLLLKIKKTIDEEPGLT